VSADVLHEWSGTFIRHPLAAKKKCLAKSNKSRNLLDRPQSARDHCC
jgi:hypothetical protein